jgi:peptidoglycan/LPS O-acetylase OafA/YrhL
MDVGSNVTKSDRIGNMDAIRGIAALTVAFYHCREINWVGMGALLAHRSPHVTADTILSLLTAPFMFGGIGVPILFVVSGYLIHLSSAQRASRGDRTLDVRNFYTRRFVRIYPTLILALCVTAAFDLVTRSMIDHYKLGNLSAQAFATNLFSLQGILGKPYGSNAPLWSLAIEVQFYLVYPAALLIWRKVGSTAMLIAVSLFSLLMYFVLERRGIVAFPQYYMSWWMGAFLADRHVAGRPLRVWWGWGVATLLIGCAMSVKALPYFSFVFWSAGFALILEELLQIRGALASKATQFLSIFGNFSYSIYAFHLPTIVLLNTLLLGGRHADTIFATYGIFAVAVTATFAMYFCAERPSIRLLQRMASRRVSDAAPSPQMANLPRGS